MSVFVTVGTTSFDELTQLISSDPVLKILKSHNFKSVTVQYGRGKYEVTNSNNILSVEGYRYKNSITDDIKNASLVISHAGAGTCLEVLGVGKPLLVVVNENLMNNHQIELAKQLYDDGHLLYCTCKTLISTLKEMDISSLRPLPATKTTEFGKDFSKHFSIPFS